MTIKEFILDTEKLLARVRKMNREINTRMEMIDLLIKHFCLSEDETESQ